MTAIQFLVFAALLLAWGYRVWAERGIGAGVRFMHLCNFALQLFLAPVLYLLLAGRAPVEDAVDLALIGGWAFLLAAYVGRRRPAGGPERAASVHGGARDHALRLAIYSLIAVGLFAFVFQGPLAAVTRSRAVPSALSRLVFTGCLLLAVHGAVTRNWATWAKAGALMTAVAAAGGLIEGHLAAGMIGAAQVWLVGLVGVRPSALRVAGAALLVLVALFTYNFWITGRKALREGIGAGKSIEQRWSDLRTTSAGWSGAGERQVFLIRKRVDQSWLFQRAIEHVPSHRPYAGTVMFERVLQAAVPRSLWPDKPVVAGGKHFVQDHTGIKFIGDTSVGMHTIFDFYVHFGVLGVILGMAALGLVCRYLEGLVFATSGVSFAVRVAAAQVSWSVLLNCWVTEIVMTAIPAGLVGWALCRFFAWRTARDSGFDAPRLANATE